MHGGFVDAIAIKKYIFIFQASSEDVDDEEFYIKINFGMFALPEIDSKMDISKVKNSAQVLLFIKI